MFKFFLILFLSFCSAYADFKNDLPSDYPIAPHENTSPSHSGIKKDKSTSQTKKKSENNKKTENTIQTKTKDQSSQNNDGGAFSSEVGSHDSNAPVFFTGHHGIGSRTTGILNLTGDAKQDAVITQDDTTLKSNQAQIFSTPGVLPTPGGNRIQRAVATGHVRINKKQNASSPEIKAIGDECEFLVPERIVILKGKKAKVWRANEYLDGDVIKIGLNTGLVEVIRPEGTIDPRSANNTFGNKDPKKIESQKINSNSTLNKNENSGE